MEADLQKLPEQMAQMKTCSAGPSGAGEAGEAMGLCPGKAKEEVPFKCPDTHKSCDLPWKLLSKATQALMSSGEVTVDTEISEGNRLKNEVIRSTLVYDGPTNEKRQYAAEYLNSPCAICVEIAEIQDCIMRLARRDALMSPVRHSELETCFQLGCVLAGYGQHEKAIQAFLDMENHMATGSEVSEEMKAMIEGYYRESWFLLAASYVQLGNFEEAAVYMKKWNDIRLARMIQRQGIYVIDIDKDGKEVKTSITSVEQFDKHIRKTQGPADYSPGSAAIQMVKQQTRDIMKKFAAVMTRSLSDDECCPGESCSAAADSDSLRCNTPCLEPTRAVESRCE